MGQIGYDETLDSKRLLGLCQGSDSKGNPSSKPQGDNELRSSTLGSPAIVKRGQEGSGPLPALRPLQSLTRCLGGELLSHSS